MGALTALCLCAVAAAAGSSERTTAELVGGVPSTTVTVTDPLPAAGAVHTAATAKNDACRNTTFLALENICIHSDHSGHCGTKGQDAFNVVLNSDAECRALCCEHPDDCAAYLFYESYNGTCCTAPGCTANTTTPPSAPGAPCCWLKSAIGPAHLWSNDKYCSSAGVVYVPGPL